MPASATSTCASGRDAEAPSRSLGLQPAGDEREHLERLGVERVHVVDAADHRLGLARLGQQGEDRQDRRGIGRAAVRSSSPAATRRAAPWRAGSAGRCSQEWRADAAAPRRTTSAPRTRTPAAHDPHPAAAAAAFEQRRLADARPRRRARSAPLTPLRADVTSASRRVARRRGRIRGTGASLMIHTLAEPLLPDAWRFSRHPQTTPAARRCGPALRGAMLRGDGAARCESWAEASVIVDHRS